MKRGSSAKARVQPLRNLLADYVMSAVVFSEDKTRTPII